MVDLVAILVATFGVSYYELGRGCIARIADPKEPIMLRHGISLLAILLAMMQKMM
jgi:hypothetical protein